MNEQIDTPRRLVGIAAGAIRTLNHVPDCLGGLVDHITFGSFTLTPRDGNKEPRYWHGVRDGLFCSINAIGLANQGLIAFLDELQGNVELYQVHKALGCRIRVSLAPTKTEDVEKMAAIFYQYRDVGEELIDEVEINAACPNHRKEGCQTDVLAHSPDDLEGLMCEGSYIATVPRAVKIAPKMSEEALRATVELAIRYNYRTIVSGNTERVRAEVDGESVLSVEYGGLGGTPLLDGACTQTRCLVQIMAQEAIPRGTIRIIGCGGAMDPESVHRHIDAGAELVQLGTYYHTYGGRGVQDLVMGLT